MIADELDRFGDQWVGNSGDVGRLAKHQSQRWHQAKGGGESCWLDPPAIGHRLIEPLGCKVPGSDRIGGDASERRSRQFAQDWIVIDTDDGNLFGNCNALISAMVQDDLCSDVIRAKQPDRLREFRQPIGKFDRRTCGAGFAKQGWGLVERTFESSELAAGDECLLSPTRPIQAFGTTERKAPESSFVEMIECESGDRLIVGFDPRDMVDTTCRTDIHNRYLQARYDFGDSIRLDPCDRTVDAHTCQPRGRIRTTLLFGKVDRPSVMLAMVFDDPFEQTSRISIRGFDQQGYTFSAFHSGSHRAKPTRTRFST